MSRARGDREARRNDRRDRRRPGLGLQVPATVAVNYFGMIATLEDLRPPLAGPDAPRAAGVSSVASLLLADDEFIDLMLAGDEAAALTRAAVLAETEDGGGPIYSSSKAAFRRWRPPQRHEAGVGRRWDPAQRRRAGCVRHADDGRQRGDGGGA